MILKENEKDLTGAIVGVILCKMSEAKEFVLNEIITIEPPFVLGT